MKIACAIYNDNAELVVHYPELFVCLYCGTNSGNLINLKAKISNASLKKTRLKAGK